MHTVDDAHVLDRLVLLRYRLIKVYTSLLAWLIYH
jgi:hypothetical protein